MRKYRIKFNPVKCVFSIKAGKFLGLMVRKNEIELTGRSQKH